MQKVEIIYIKKNFNGNIKHGMKAIIKCTKCSKTFLSNRDLQKHLDKKYPCDKAEFDCSKCGAKLFTKDSKRVHERNCNGPVLSREEELEEKIEELNKKFEELSTPSTSETVETITPVGYGKLADCIRPQLYFGLPGDLLVPLIPTEYFIIKFGSTKEPAARIPTHSKDFGGFELLDSIVTNNFIEVEDKIRDWLKINGKLIRAKTVNKPTTDTEIFVVKDQLEYETIVKIAKIFSDEMENRSTNQTLKEIEWEKEKLEYEKRCLQMERELMQAHV